MAKIESIDWVAERVGRSGFLLIDPRRPMKYLSGHLPGAINLPVYRAFGADGRLLDAESLAGWIGGAGFGSGLVPIIYDSPEGQNAAMLAWILEYLGCTEIHVMEAFFENWKAAGREVLYKPVEDSAKKLAIKPNRSIRATLDELREANGVSFVDFRSVEEFQGEKTLGDDRPGHIPGAANIVWRDLGMGIEHLLKPGAELARAFDTARIKPGDKLIAYCRSGPRAALGYLALRQMGYDARLFDGSFAEWSRAGLPVEK